jgi:uncharacterized protein YjbI with pentapeptide repeats
MTCAKNLTWLSIGPANIAQLTPFLQMLYGLQPVDSHIDHTPLALLYQRGTYPLMNRPAIYTPVSILCTFLVLSLSGPSSVRAADAQALKENLEKLQQTKNCKGCNLAGASLNRLELAGADLEGADLSGAKVTLTNLSRANLRNANLRGTLFGGSDLSDADLRGADLRGASLDSSYHQGARFDGEFVTSRSYVDVGEPEVEKEVFVADTATPKKAPEPAKVAIEGEPGKDKVTAKATSAVISTPPPATAIKVESQIVGGTVAPPAKKVAPPPAALVDEQPQLAEQAKVVMVDKSRDVKEVVPKVEHKAKVEPEVKAEPVVKPDPIAKAEPVTKTEQKVKIEPEAKVEPVVKAESIAKAQPPAQGVGVVAADEVESAKPAPQPPAKVQPIAEKKTEVPSPERQKSPEPVKEAVSKEGGADKLAAFLSSKKCYACKLNDCNLAGKNLAKADLEKADLSGCNLEDADLDGANLKGTLLRKANLKNTSLENADLYKADLTRADLTGAKLKGAMLDGAKVDGAVGLKEAKLEAEK